MYKLHPEVRRKGESALGLLSQYIERVKIALEPSGIYLFGSYARGDINELSDIDLVVIADFKESFKDRIYRLLELNTDGLNLEPFGYTAEEFREMRERGNRFVIEILREGKRLL